MKNRVIEYISNNYNELQSITKKITGNHQDSDDILHECLIQIIEKEQIILDDEKNIKYYVIGVIKINYYSKTSPVWYKLKREMEKYAELTIDIQDENSYDYEKEEILCSLETSLCEMDWFHRQLLEQYMLLGSLKKVNKVTKIPIPSISRYINEAKEIIKQEINKKHYDLSKV